MRAPTDVHILLFVVKQTITGVTIFFFLNLQVIDIENFLKKLEKKIQGMQLFFFLSLITSPDHIYPMSWHSGANLHFKHIFEGFEHSECTR